ncbi:LysR family transcriptional regulator [Acinetobacter indicus]|uniref:LysR family transcriptional regulator n=1 Tax=Acinetobacter indicus TaxID=756892 RepID=UPI001443CEBD|nr:LysR family transcriptional regulator [Acinetobacter indicus]MDM1278419.1 LysR family transcriptional regulator [Acinetobacter indicus]
MNTPFSRFSEYFIAVAQTGSLRKAAEQLFISVSAVHRQIVLAEQELGIALFERLNHGLRLTLAGELLYADLLKWHKEFQQTRIRFDEIQGLHRGSIEFGLISALSESFVLHSMQHMSQHYPWIDFHVHVLDSEKVAQMIQAAELDFGLLLNPQAHPHLEAVAFVEIPLGFVIPVEHSLAEQTPLYFSDTLPYAHLIPAAPLIIHEYVSALYKHHQFSPCSRIECNDIRMLMSLLKQNLGLGLMSYLDALPLLEHQTAIFKPVQDKGLYPLTLALCVAPKRQLSRIAQIMMKQLTEQMEQLQQQIAQL